MFSTRKGGNSTETIITTMFTLVDMIQLVEILPTDDDFISKMRHLPYWTL